MMYLEQRLDNLENMLNEVRNLLEQAVVKTESNTKKELQLMTVAKSAEYIGRSENTIRNYLLQGVLTKYDGIGKNKIMIDVEELDRLKQQGVA